MKFRSWRLIFGVVPAASGCYQYAPLDTSAGVQAGEHIAVDISDKGRAELSDRIGSGVLRLEGTLTRADSASIEMNVWRVASIVGGPTARWSGESVTFDRSYASRVQTRSLNLVRTYLVAGAAVGGLVLFTSQFDLLGFGSQDNGEEDPPGPVTSRGWWP